ncbi:Uncharacterised protein [Vibrio cholerae]|nr:Uncharacterised protein [Vibrio cholerae]
MCRSSFIALIVLNDNTRTRGDEVRHTCSFDE